MSFRRQEVTGIECRSAWIAGVLATHPIARAAQTGYRQNPFYDAAVTTTAAADEASAAARLAELEQHPPV